MQSKAETGKTKRGMEEREKSARRLRSRLYGSRKRVEVVQLHTDRREKRTVTTNRPSLHLGKTASGGRSARLLGGRGMEEESAPRFLRDVALDVEQQRRLQLIQAGKAASIRPQASSVSVGKAGKGRLGEACTHRSNSATSAVNASASPPSNASAMALRNLHSRVVANEGSALQYESMARLVETTSCRDTERQFELPGNRDEIGRQKEKEEMGGVKRGRERKEVARNAPPLPTSTAQP